MTLMLQHYHARIKEGLRDMRRHCAASCPDMPGLSATRHRQGRNFTDNSKYIYDVLIPMCRAQAGVEEERELGETIRLLNEKRFAISAHISRWGSREIERDWDGYRRVALQVCDFVDEQLLIEQAYFGQFQQSAEDDALLR